MHICQVPRWLASSMYYSLWPKLRPKGHIGTLTAVARKRMGGDWHSAEEIWKHQLTKVNALLGHVIGHVPYYRELAEAGKVPERIEKPEHLAGIPILTKEIIRREGRRLLAENFPSERLRPCATGGSTGQPLHFWSDDTVTRAKNAAESWALTLAGLTLSSPIALLWGAGDFEPTSGKSLRVGIQRLITNRIFINCFQMSEEDLLKAHRRLSRCQPAAFIGYSSALVEFAAFLDRCGLRPTYPRKAVLSSAETLDDISRRKLAQVFGVPVYDRYGSREIGLIAMECDHHEGLHINCEDVLVELVDDPGGSDLKRIIITKLNQFSMPFLRYEIEDLAEGPLAACSCGRGYPVIKRVVGRVTEVVRLPDGACLPGELFPHLFKDCGIKTYQVIQSADYAVNVSLVATEDHTPEQDETLRRVIEQHVRALVPVHVHYVDRIERSETGKLLPVISHAPLSPPARAEESQ